MAYIGTIPTSGDFVLLDSITTSATASYTMQKNSVNFTPQSANHMIVSLNGTIQAPVSSFTVSGSTLTFASALTSSDVIDFILVLGNVNDVGVASSVVDSAITKNKTDFITDGSSAGITVKGSGSDSGSIALNCSSNSHAIQLISPDHSAGQSYKLKLPDNNVTADKFIKVKSITGSGATATGQLEFADAGGGDFVRLSTIDQDLGSSQKIQFTSVFTSDYDFYRLIGRANVGSLQQALLYFRWLNSSDAEQTSAEYHYAYYGRYSNTNDSGGNVAGQKMGETYADLVTDFYGGSYSRTMFFDMTFYPKVNSSPDRSAFQGMICYNAYNSGSGGWNATSIGGTYNSDTDLSGGGLQIECNTSFDYVTMSLYGVKLA